MSRREQHTPALNDPAQSQPQRRTMLKGLAALPAVALLARPTHAASIAVASPDASLIAEAAKVEDLARREREASLRSDRLFDEFERLAPKMPPSRDAEAVAARWAEYDAHATGPATPERNPVFQEANRRAGAIQRAIKAEHAAAMKAWEAECAAIRIRIGLDDAARSASRLFDELEIAGRNLATMPATTIEGLEAKARAVLELRKSGLIGNDWDQALTFGTVEEILAVAASARS